MLSFLGHAHTLPRSHSAHLNPLATDNGGSSFHFHTPATSPYLMTCTLQPRLVSEMPPSGRTQYPAQASSTMPPPPHFHTAQDETFVVSAGRMLAEVERRQRVLEAGQSVVIARGTAHTFANASAAEALVVDVKLDPEGRVKDERFFRNVYGYLEDCRRAEVAPSLLQAMLFLWNNGTIIALPGPKFIARPLGKLILWIGGVLVGKGLLGYKDSYPEYFKEPL